MAILSTADFLNGKYIIPVQGQQKTDLERYIDSVENMYLPRLFGKDLYDLFLADLALPTVGEPTSPRFKKVFDEFNEQPDECLWQSEGIKHMLKGFVYYHFIKDDTSRVTTVGIKLTSGENSENVTAIHHDTLCRYNDSVSTYRAIQWWMRDQDESNYPEFKGIHLKYNHPY